MTEPARRAAIYCRISVDATGEKAGVERQRSDCLAYCADRGWEVVTVEIDNDISASDYSRKRRPGYEAVLAAVESGEVDTIVAWHVDRLYRRNRDLEGLIELANRAQISTLNGDLDLMTGDGKAMARILVTMAAKSSDDTSRRILRKLEERAANGLAHGRRAFGYEKDGALRADEAALIRQAVADVLAGASLAEIARRWNGAGVQTSQTGKSWNGTVVKQMLVNPRLAGLRVHRGEIVGDAAWPAIVDRSDFERLVGILKNPSRRMANPPRRTAFTGLFRCGLCGVTMTRNVVRGHSTYACHKAPGLLGCGKIAVTGAPLEDLITESAFIGPTRLSGECGSGCGAVMAVSAK